jgi:hypothetical protein
MHEIRIGGTGLNPKVVGSISVFKGTCRRHIAGGELVWGRERGGKCPKGEPAINGSANRRLIRIKEELMKAEQRSLRNSIHPHQPAGVLCRPLHSAFRRLKEAITTATRLRRTRRRGPGTRECATSMDVPVGRWAAQATCPTALARIAGVSTTRRSIPWKLSQGRDSSVS